MQEPHFLSALISEFSQDIEELQSGISGHQSQDDSKAIAPFISSLKAFAENPIPSNWNKNWDSMVDHCDTGYWAYEPYLEDERSDVQELAKQTLRILELFDEAWDMLQDQQRETRMSGLYAIEKIFPGILKADAAWKSIMLEDSQRVRQQFPSVDQFSDLQTPLAFSRLFEANNAWIEGHLPWEHWETHWAAAQKQTATILSAARRSKKDYAIEQAEHLQQLIDDFGPIAKARHRANIQYAWLEIFVALGEMQDIAIEIEALEEAENPSSS